MRKNLKRGIFITFEGGEGAGKSTLIKSIKKSLEKKYPIVQTREPGSTVLGDRIRNILLSKGEKISSFSELCLYLSSRSQHIEEIIMPALLKKKIVLCDRFNDSTIAYQGYARGLGFLKVKKFCNFISQNLKPDITIYLDIDPKVGLKRVKTFDRLESEGISFHLKVRKAFNILCKKEKRFFKIDAKKSKKEIFEKSLFYILKKIKRYVR